MELYLEPGAIKKAPAPRGRARPSDTRRSRIRDRNELKPRKPPLPPEKARDPPP